MRVLLGIFVCLVFLGQNVRAQEHTFTVRDSIEMVRFDRVDPKIEFSPDDRFFAVVTSRGILRADTVESTIWIFSTEKTRATTNVQDRTIALHYLDASGHVRA